MTTMSAYRNCLIIFLLFSLTACASSRQRFPDYGEVAKTQSSIPVVLDLFVYRDIVGSNKGYNKSANSTYIDEAVTQIEKSLKDRGFISKLLISMNGLTYNIEEGSNIVVSEDWKSTGQAYLGLELDKDEDPWRASATKEFVWSLFETGKEMNLPANKDQAYAENKVRESAIKANKQTPKKIGDIPINPLLFKDLDSDIVLFIKTEGRFQKLGKYLTQGLLVGAASSALTGGFVVIPPGSYALTEVVAFNIKTNQILWHNSVLAEGKSSVKTSVKKALSAYPFSDGQTKWEKERERRKESLRK